MKVIQILFILVNVGALGFGIYEFTSVNEQIRLWNIDNPGVASESPISLAKYIEYSYVSRILKVTLAAWFLFTLVHLLVNNQNKNNARTTS